MSIMQKLKKHFDEGVEQAIQDLKGWGTMEPDNLNIMLIIGKVEELKKAHDMYIHTQCEEQQIFWQGRMYFCYGYIAEVAAPSQKA